ncbi:unnamed protein product [Anisakis simplex]|uniref:AcidPPc domain-containing protein n=1 Tax=Anisakis simplex TaxID=6269 RepID=A0A0M3JZB2_ANISI|nr:unnamed protein product [Anisakis simplex]
MLGKYSLTSRYARRDLVPSTSSASSSSADNQLNERSILIRCTILMGIDICISLIASYVIYKVITKSLVFPVERGFYCHEIQELSSPCFLLAVIVNQLCKCAIGRLRPNFLAVCDPRWDKIDCTSDPYRLITNAFCRGSPKAIKKARTSCPSGHATASVLAMCFLISYFDKILPKSAFNGTMKMIQYIVLITFYLWNGYCLVTRITDMWHFPSDVIYGALIGFLAAYIFFMRKRPQNNHRKFHTLKS